LKLPEWQLEPDDEYMFGGDPEDYYYIDESGNLVEPQRPGPGQNDPFPAEGEQVPTQPARRPVPGDEATQAASDDFLDSATGARPNPPSPAPTPRLRAPTVAPPQPGAVRPPVN
jgi:penicillin-binding protein 1A